MKPNINNDMLMPILVQLDLGTNCCKFVKYLCMFFTFKCRKFTKRIISILQQHINDVILSNLLIKEINWIGIESIEGEDLSSS